MPLTHRLICFAPKEEYVLDRFFAFVKANRPGATIFVLSMPVFLKQVKALVENYPSLRIIVAPYPVAGAAEFYSPNNIGSRLKEKVRPWKVEGVVLIPGQARNFRYLPNLYSPPLKPHYNQFRIFHLLGIEKISIFNLNTVQPVEFPFFLDDFVNIHKGRRCFVVGNGPSLQQVDMTKLRGEITIGSNRCYLGFEEWGFSFNYWCIVDSLQIEKYMPEWEKNIHEDVIKFFPFEYLNLFNLRNSCPVNFFPPQFPNNPTNFHDPLLRGFLSQCPNFSDRPDVVFLGHTVTYAMLQIAVIMGCNPIYLVGVDNRYQLTVVDEKKGVWLDDTGSSHFHGNYTVGKEFHLPNQQESEAFFDFAESWAWKKNITIRNASPDTALESFEKVSFDKIFESAAGLEPEGDSGTSWRNPQEPREIVMGRPEPTWVPLQAPPEKTPIGALIWKLYNNPPSIWASTLYTRLRKKSPKELPPPSGQFVAIPEKQRPAPNLFAPAILHSKSVSILVCTPDIHSNFAQTCIERVKQHTQGARYELLVFENGKLGTFRHATEINRVIDIGHGDAVVLLDDDVEVTPGWLEAMLELAAPDVAVVGCVNVHSREEYATSVANIRQAGGWVDAEGRVISYRENLTGPAFVPFQGSACLLINDLTQRFDANYQKYYFDIDYCFGAWEKNKKVIVSPHKIFHYGAGQMEATGLSPEDIKQASSRDGEIFKNKWIVNNRLARLYEKIENELTISVDLAQFGEN